jgi:DNA polymerase III subunit epsilon
MPIIAIDFETANSQRASPCAIGIARLGPTGLSAELRLIRPPVMAFDDFNMMLHGITPEMVKNAPELPEIWADLRAECEASTFVLAHNAGFDIGVLCATLALYGLPLPRLSYLCTRIVARHVWPGLSGYGLENVARHLALALDHHHAGSDALAALGIATAAAEMRGVSAVEDLPHALGLKLLPRLSDGQISGYRSPKTFRKMQLKLPPENLDPEHPLFACGVTFNGALISITRADAAQAVIDRGGQFFANVGKGTDYLIVGELDYRRFTDGEKSAKLRKAEAMALSGAIEIIGEREFLHLLNG